MAICLIAGGSATLAVQGATEVVLPDGTRLEQIDFQRHVVPVITRFGCNAANCHGSFQGRGGFHLSLFGHAGTKDLEALADRLDLQAPRESLILTKPSMQEEHGGGKRFDIDSWPYQILLAWIEQGARPASNLHADSLEEITVSPGAVRFEQPDVTVSFKVQARFSDKSREAVTPLCRFESHDSGVAEVTADGVVRALRPGATHIIVSYAGGFATVPVTIPYPTRSGAVENAVANSTTSNTELGFIDRVIDDQLRQLNLATAPPAEDAQFLRRVTLDTLGRLPTVVEIREFLESQDSQKRTAAIDRLLADPQHASLWATRLCDLTGCRLETMEGPDKLKPMRARMWHEWFRQRLIDGVPWDQIVHAVISGSSRDGLSAEEYLDREIKLLRGADFGSAGDYPERPGLDLFYRRTSTDGVYPRDALAERTAAAFLGIRIQCARCHQHPYDRWTQGDYASFVNIFADVTFGSSTELNQAVLARLDTARQQRTDGAPAAMFPRVQEVYDDPQFGHHLPDPEEKTAARPRPLGGHDLNPASDLRTALADWMVRPDNPWFAQNWVNRVWAHYFGRGLVEPVDGFSATNPATHLEVLKRLAAEFVQSGYDMQHIERLILTSAAYQRSTAHDATFVDADRHYACSTVRPLMAEAVVQILDDVLKSPSPWTVDVPAGRTVMDVAPNRAADQRLAYLLELFDRGTRESVCDCDRTGQPSLRQTLHLMSDAAWIDEIQKSPLIDELLREPDDKQAIQNVVLQTMSRFPTADENKVLVNHLQAPGDRRAAWVDIVWALVNSREFRTNH